jgi:phage gp36-like protein
MSSYASPSDLTTYGINAAAVAGFSTPQIQAALDARASFIDGALSSKVTLPLVSWGADIRMYCAITAAYDLMTSRGYDPSDGSNENLSTRYEAMEAWLGRVSSGKYMPVVKDSSPISATDPGGSGPFVQQALVYGGQYVPNGLSIQGAAPASVSQNANGGTVAVGQPVLRGWNRR